jgi:DNA-binding IclR family transcriptional regulator
MLDVQQGGTVRSVQRALAIIELLGEHQALGLEELHCLTTLPKATLSRLLLTLQQQGWAYRGLADRRYRLCARRLFGDAQLRARRELVERAAPGLLELSERTGLVADLSSFDGERLQIVESAIPAVLRKRYPANCQLVGQHASLFHSAMGKACLGELAAEQVERLAASAQVGAAECDAAMYQARREGYGQRTAGHWEYPVKLPFLIGAMALPVRVGGRLLGSMALHWPQDLQAPAAVRREQLAQLAGTVRQVQQALA